ncbi:hypothetical protein [Prevotella intermedia]|uniref:hypothetical protein n=1 Tax=Prevotella intermedia TaxID=28131 RepID=UPI0012FDAA5F|nr:hypothetical protein [Prevotella intermedia]
MRKDNQLKREKAEEYIKKSNPTGGSPPYSTLIPSLLLSNIKFETAQLHSNKLIFKG